MSVFQNKSINSLAIAEEFSLMFALYADVVHCILAGTKQVIRYQLVEINGCEVSNAC